VPGEVRGLELAWQRHGRLPWRTLFEPAIALATAGFPVSQHTADSIAESWELIRDQPALAALLAPGGVPLRAGDTLKRPKLAATLQRIAEERASAFYRGPIAANTVRAIATNAVPGNLTLQDLEEYRALVRTPATLAWNGMQLLLAPAPASGHVLGMIFNILGQYHPLSASLDTLAYHRTVEAFKFAYAKRTLLADPCCSPTTTPLQCLNASACAAIEALETLMLDPAAGLEWRQKILDNRTFHDPSYYGAHYDLTATPGAADQRPDLHPSCSLRS
jgi:gamma-glutamyltranspeptidase/glutathione hydrolase/leukotriene-C4 hydrolase